MLYRVHLAWAGFELTALVVIEIQLPYDHDHDGPLKVDDFKKHF